MRSEQHRADHTRATTGALLAVLLLIPFAGCRQPLRPIFEEHRPPLTWPAAPDRARIRYVGQISTTADLKPPPKLFQGLTDLLLGPTPPDPLYGPRAILRTPDGERLWIADPGGRCLHLLNLQDRTYKKIDRVGDAPLLSPVGICLGPDESIFVCDSESVAIHRLSSRDGTLIESLRLTSDLLRPVAVYYDRNSDELFVVDVKAHSIQVLSPDGRLRRILGRRGNEPGEFNFPCAIAADRERLWIADTGNHRIQAITRTGEPISEFGSVGDAPGNLALPKGVALDSDGHIYVVDSRFENIQVFDRDGRVLLFFGEEGTGPGEFWLPAGITLDHDDRIWVCDSYNRRVQVFDYIKPAAPPDDQVASPPQTEGR